MSAVLRHTCKNSNLGCNFATNEVSSLIEHNYTCLPSLILKLQEEKKQLLIENGLLGKRNMEYAHKLQSEPSSLPVLNAQDPQSENGGHPDPQQKKDTADQPSPPQANSPASEQHTGAQRVVQLEELLRLSEQRERGLFHTQEMLQQIVHTHEQQNLELVRQIQDMQTKLTTQQNTIELLVKQLEDPSSATSAPIKTDTFGNQSLSAVQAVLRNQAIAASPAQLSTPRQEKSVKSIEEEEGDDNDDDDEYESPYTTLGPKGVLHLAPRSLANDDECTYVPFPRTSQQLPPYIPDPREHHKYSPISALTSKSSPATSASSSFLIGSSPSALTQKPTSTTIQKPTSTTTQKPTATTIQKPAAMTSVLAQGVIPPTPTPSSSPSSSILIGNGSDSAKKQESPANLTSDSSQASRQFLPKRSVAKLNAPAVTLGISRTIRNHNGSFEKTPTDRRLSRSNTVSGPSTSSSILMENQRGEEEEEQLSKSETSETSGKPVHYRDIPDSQAISKSWQDSLPIQAENYTSFVKVQSEGLLALPETVQELYAERYWLFADVFSRSQSERLLCKSIHPRAFIVRHSSNITDVLVISRYSTSEKVFEHLIVSTSKGQFQLYDMPQDCKLYKSMVQLIICSPVMRGFVPLLLSKEQGKTLLQMDINLTFSSPTPALSPAVNPSDHYATYIPKIPEKKALTSNDSSLYSPPPKKSNEKINEEEPTDEVASTGETYSSVEQVLQQHSQKGELAAPQTHQNLQKMTPPPKFHTVSPLMCSTVFRGHSGLVRSLDFSGDGAMVVSASFDKSLKIWDAKSGTCINTFKNAHNGWIWTCRFGQGKQIASGAWDYHVKIWDIETKELNQVYKSSRRQVLACNYCHSKKVLGTCFVEDCSIVMWDTTNQNDQKKIEIKAAHPVWSFSFSKHNTQLVAGLSGGHLQLWDVTDFSNPKAIYMNKGHFDSIRSCTFSLNDQKILTGSWDKTCKIWSLSGTLLVALRGHSAPVWACTFASQDKIVVSAAEDGQIRIWDALKGAALEKIQGHESQISCISVSPVDDNVFLTGSDDRLIKMWEYYPKRPAALALLLCCRRFDLTGFFALLPLPIFQRICVLAHLIV